MAPLRKSRIRGRGFLLTIRLASRQCLTCSCRRAAETSARTSAGGFLSSYIASTHDVAAAKSVCRRSLGAVAACLAAAALAGCASSGGGGGRRWTGGASTGGATEAVEPAAAPGASPARGVSGPGGSRAGGTTGTGGASGSAGSSSGGVDRQRAARRVGRGGSGGVTGTGGASASGGSSSGGVAGRGGASGSGGSGSGGVTGRGGSTGGERRPGRLLGSRRRQRRCGRRSEHLPPGTPLTGGQQYLLEHQGQHRRRLLL